MRTLMLRRHYKLLNDFSGPPLGKLLVYASELLVRLLPKAVNLRSILDKKVRDKWVILRTSKKELGTLQRQNPPVSSRKHCPAGLKLLPIKRNPGRPINRRNKSFDGTCANNERARGA